MLFGHDQRGRWLLNIGGMANVTWVPRRGVPDGAFAFDTGPGVAVIDAITRRVDPDAAFDEGGERARRGRPVAKLLDELLADPYFDQPPPKSTGRERFGIEYADKLLARVRKAGGSDNDAVATATALTAESIGRAIARWGKDDTAAVVLSGARASSVRRCAGGAAHSGPNAPTSSRRCPRESVASFSLAALVLPSPRSRARCGTPPAVRCCSAPISSAGRGSRSAVSPSCRRPRHS